MEKETYGVLLIIGFVLVVAVGFMYYGASAGKASMFAKDATDTVKCVFKNSEIVQKCIAERYGVWCDGVGSCEMRVKAKYGSHTNVGACGGSCGIRIEGKYRTCDFNCGPQIAQEVKEQVKCIFEPQAEQKIEQKCYSADPGISQFSCAGIGGCIVDVKGKSGEKITWKSSCGNYAYTILDGKNDYAKFDCKVSEVSKGYGVGEKFKIEINKQTEVYFKTVGTPVRLAMMADNSFYFNDYSPGYLSGGQVVHIPIGEMLVVIRLIGGSPSYAEFKVEYIGGVEKSYKWPSLPEPVENIAITEYRPRPDTVKVPSGSVIALKCDRLCYISGLFDVNVGYEIRALNANEIGKFLARVGQSKFMVFAWGKFFDGEIIAVYGAVTPPPQSPTQESMVPGG